MLFSTDLTIVPIYEGIKAKKYPQSKVYIAENLDDALKNGAPDTTLSAVYAAVGGKNNIKNYTSFRPTWNIDTSELNDYEIIGNHCFFTE